MPNNGGVLFLNPTPPFFFSIFNFIWSTILKHWKGTVWLKTLYFRALTFSLRKVCFGNAVISHVVLSLSFSEFTRKNLHPSAIICLSCCTSLYIGWRQWFVRVLRKCGRGGDKDHPCVCGCLTPCARAPTPADPGPADLHGGRRQIPLGPPGTTVWAVCDQNCDCHIKHRQG